jgi:hypothetical protein
VLGLIVPLFLLALALSESQWEKRTAELALAAKSAELEVVARSQVERIAELETACTNLKHEMESVTAGYRRLSEKHKAFIEKTEHEKWSLQKSMLQSLPGSVGIWICRCTTIWSIVRMCGASIVNFMKQLHRHSRKSRNSVCPSLAKAQR